GLPVDTLTFIDWVSPGIDSLSYPRSIGYDPNGLLWITDTARHVILTLSQDQTILTYQTAIPLSYPYLAGFRGNSVYVFSPAFHRMYELADGQIRREVALEGPLPEEGGLRYAIVTETGFAVKVAANEFDSYLATTDDFGVIDRKIDLKGEEWRYAGLLRSHSGKIFSLAGYLPLIDSLGSAGLDSLQLFGFDSPMLPRTRQFQLGDTHEPPLLSASADRAGKYWFVLNMRPGWTQVDVYSPGGELQYILTEPNPAFNQDFFPTDIAVFEMEDGRFQVAISILKPEPRIDRFYWQP
ncbi:MAG: hypothetical protein O3B41_09955, partial [Bacteroidetes bacterium]|nr:hypothetical protein [Bacteroidota bacterium]